MSEWLKAYEHLIVFAIFISDLIGTVFLIMEYYFGRPDIAIRNEAKQKKRLRKTELAVSEPQSLTTGEMK